MSSYSVRQIVRPSQSGRYGDLNLIIIFSVVDFFRTNFLDEEWFGFETAGTLVVGWEGGPTRPVEPRGGKRLAEDTEAELARLQASRLDALDLAEHESRPRTTATGIEIAAALATGMVWSHDRKLRIILKTNIIEFSLTHRFKKLQK